MNYVCGDNRFEIIERYKNELISATNIESSPDEMAVLDNILFRFWQMGLLKEQEAKTGKWIPIESTTGVEAFGVKEMTVMNVCCSVCGSEEDVSFTGYKYCPRCGAKMTDRR